jgi:hypothetical protein
VPSILLLTTAENLNLHPEVGGDAISFLREAYPRKSLGIKTIPTTETEIRSIIHSLKAKNSLDYIGITSKILKVCACPIYRPLTHIWSHSLFTKIFPDHLNISVVKPLYKKGDKN